MKKIIILIVSILSSCISYDAKVNSQITSVITPSYSGKISKGILIFVKTDDLIIKQNLESYSVNYFNVYEVNAYEANSLLPPVKKYSTWEIQNICKKNKIDSILILTVQQAGYQEQQVTTNNPYYTTGKVNQTWDNRYQYSAITTGGPQTQTIRKPQITIKSELIDPKTEQIMWIATTYSGGNAYSTIETVLNASLQKIVEKLHSDGFIMKNQGNK